MLMLLLLLLQLEVLVDNTRGEQFQRGRPADGGVCGELLSAMLSPLSGLQRAFSAGGVLAVDAIELLLLWSGAESNRSRDMHG
jgi:hypothetical protein